MTTKQTTKTEQAPKPTPKRILSLDGGGIRGCLSLGYLAQIEAIVRQRLNNEEAVLSDYFDLIGGTSTGALIAAQLALGYTVERVRNNYKKLGPEVFSRKTWLARIPILGSKLFTTWSIKPLEKEIKATLSEKLTLGSPNIKTGLCIVTKRADTFSTWPFINHPQGRFYPDNCDIPLWKLLRASSAAPTFFRPIKLDIGTPDAPDEGIFVDGGVSMANNPSLQLFQVATLKGFPYHWETGEDKLQIVSVGTGYWKRTAKQHHLRNPSNLFWAKNVPELLMLDANDHTELMMQYLSDSPTNRQIDWQMGDLSQDVLGGTPACSYIRYNVKLESGSAYANSFEEKDHAIQNILNAYDDDDMRRLRQMDNGRNTDDLLKLGDAFAQIQVNKEHFPA